MPKVKYFNRNKASINKGKEAVLPPFDIEILRSKGWIAKIIGDFFRNSLWWLKLLRKFWPVARLGRIVLLTRAVDVQEVLTNPKVFSVPFGFDMKAVSGGNNFILGMNKGDVYRKQKKVILAAFPPSQMADKISKDTKIRAAECMRSAPSGFNPIKDLFAKSAVMICEDYFGLIIADKQRFYESAQAITSLLFADPFGSKEVQQLGISGSKYLLQTIDYSIEKAKESSKDTTPLEKLVLAHQADPLGLPLDDIRAIMTGMIQGFLPTTILAVGNVLQVILKKPEALKAVLAAIKMDDDAQLENCVTEAMRFNPIQIGPFRICEQDYILSNKIFGSQKKIRKNTLILPSTFSAMFDPERVANADLFLPDRDQKDSMIFGYGLHSCIGAPMASAFSTQVIKALFSLPNIKRAAGAAGKMTHLGIFPDSISLVWDQAEYYADQAQSMVTVCIPINSSIDLSRLKEILISLGNVAGLNDDSTQMEKGISQALNAYETIHFVSGGISDAVHDDDHEIEPAHLIFEISGDGDELTLINSVSKALEDIVGEDVKTACGFETKKTLKDLFLKYRIQKVSPTRKNVGLLFNGAPGHSVQRIKKEAEFYQKIDKIVRSDELPDTNNWLDKIIFIREKIAQEQDFDWAFLPVRNRLSEPKKGLLQYFIDYLNGGWSLVLLLIILAFIALNFYILGGVQQNWWDNILYIGVAISMTVVSGLLLLGAIFAVVVARLRKLEKSDKTADILPNQDIYDAITSRENQLNQNHMFAISRIKDHYLRTFLMRVTLWWIQVSVGYKNKPGNVSGIDTIHFARWVRIPKTNQLLFLSNFGGSWESYLEDFITKAAAGLTSVWSNTLGFPRTKYLIQLGATLSDPFKHWARRQQRPTLFWYVAHHNITTANIRKNALVRQGFAGIDDERMAEAWFSLFGSLNRTSEGLDKANIQSLVFGAMSKQLPNSKFLFISLSDQGNSASTKAMMKQLCNKINFGEKLGHTEAWQIAFTYRGLQGLGLTDNTPETNVFSNAFCQGMDSEARINVLADHGENHPDHWHWGSGESKVDFALLYYYKKEVNEDSLGEVRKLIQTAKARIVFEQNCLIELNDNGQAIEPFGFVDGISQPIIKGTRKGFRSNQTDHIIAPGEILCGYPDERGNISTSPCIDRERDIHNLLPEKNEHEYSPEHQSINHKDFGFNGTYLVIRQLQQNVSGFNTFCELEAEKLRDKGEKEASAEWIGAKMLGRWKNGQPLVSYPSQSTSGSDENNFRYGKEDPQGLSCPLGAHIRRANPRDSLGTDHEVQLKLANRHRILRVGRSYRKEIINKNGRNGEEVGLMFMCMNADIERQFEFIQQTWINNSSFHGLINETDAVATGKCPMTNKFSIPTDKGVTSMNIGQSFVTTKGGSYFFMPGRQALYFLLSL